MASASAPSICSGPGISPQARPMASAPGTDLRFRCHRFGWCSQAENGATRRWPRTVWASGRYLRRNLRGTVSRCQPSRGGRVDSTMTFAALAFAAGVILLQQQAELPWLGWAGLLPPLLLLAVKHKGFVLPAAFAAGFFWAALLGHVRMADWLAPQLEGRDLEVTGVVSGLPAAGERSVRFELE